MAHNYPNAGSRTRLQFVQRTTLDAFNEGQEHRQLHPTKGWRPLSVKRARAQMLMAEMRNGQGRPLHLQARFLSEGY